MRGVFFLGGKEEKDGQERGKSKLDEGGEGMGWQGRDTHKDSVRDKERKMIMIAKAQTFSTN